MNSIFCKFLCVGITALRFNDLSWHLINICGFTHNSTKLYNPFLMLYLLWKYYYWESRNFSHLSHLWGQIRWDRRAKWLLVLHWYVHVQFDGGKYCGGVRVIIFPFPSSSVQSFATIHLQGEALQPRGPTSGFLWQFNSIGMVFWTSLL